MQVKKQQLELDMEQQTVSKLGKECVKAVYCHPAYLIYMQSESRLVMSDSLQSHGLYSPWNSRGQNTGVGSLFLLQGSNSGIESMSPALQADTLPAESQEKAMRNAGLDEAQAGIKIARRNINNLRYADDTILMAESEEEMKSLLMKVKEEHEKAGLKLNIQKSKIMATGSITSWQIDGKTMETVTDFLFLGSKSTADGDCSHEIKRRLLFERKAMTNLDSMLKSRDTTLSTEVHLVKAMVLSVVMYGCIGL